MGQRLLILLCVAVLALAGMPAIAYQVEAENIPNSPDWVLKVPTTGIPGSSLTGVPYASNDGALSIVDNINNAPDEQEIHNPANTEDVVYTSVSADAFNGTATAVFRMKTTTDYPFSALSTNAGWERNIVLSFSDGVYRKCIGFAVRPDGAAITNTTSTSVYGGVIPVDNTKWHTWTIVGSNFGGTGGKADVYLDGVQVISNLTVNLTTDTAIGYVNSLSVMAAVAGTNRDGTGSWLFDRVAYKAGADPTWQPWGPSGGSISGVVSKAGAPSVKVVGAKVAISSTAITTTAADGSYSFTGLEPNPYVASVTADGYFGKKTGTIPVTFTAPAATANVALTAVPASGTAAYSSFDSEFGDLTRTEDAQQLPWLIQSDQLAWTDYWASSGMLTLMPVQGGGFITQHGVSIGGGFLPANVDITVNFQDILDPGGTTPPPGWGGGILYRQSQPCVYDNYMFDANNAPMPYTVVAPYDWSSTDYPAQDPANAGYLVFCPSDGSSINLWRNGPIASAATSVDWSQPHKVRVIAYGNYHEVQLDGTRIISAIDSGKLTGGFVGLTRYERQTDINDITAQPLTDGASLGTISGSVYSAASPATKLAGALVQVSDGRMVFTDANGNYSLDLRSFDGVTITAKAAGYLDKSVWLDPAMGVNALDFAMAVDSAYRTTITDGKAVGIGSEVALSGKVITAQWGGTTMAIEEPNRSSGIKVTLPEADTSLYSKLGQQVSVRGILKADSQTGEVYIEANSAYEPPAAKIFLTPVEMNGRTVLDKSAGVDITGLDVKVVGKVIAVNEPTDFTIDDGAGPLKIVVDTSVGLSPWPAVGDYIDAEGIVGLDGVSPSSAVRCVKIWNTNVNHLGLYGSFDDPAGPMYGWGYGDTTNGACTLNWDTTNPHTGTYCAEFTNTYGYGAGMYGTLYFIAGGIPDYEYELSCWVRGSGVVGTTQASHSTDWSNYNFGLPVGDFDWTNVGTKFRLNGGLFYIRFNIVNYCSPLAIDDVVLRYARGSIHVLQAAPVE